MANTTYKFYVDSFGGDMIPEKKFLRLINLAEAIIRRYTFGNLPDDWSGEEWENQAKCAACELAEYQHKFKEREGISSENTDGYSVSYEDSSKADVSQYAIVQVYLTDTGLLCMEVPQ